MRHTLLIAALCVLGSVHLNGQPDQVITTNPMPPNSPCIGHEIHFVNQSAKTATVTYTHQKNS